MRDYESVPRPLAEMPMTRLYVYEALAEHGPAAPDELVELADVSQPTVYRAIDDLDDAGLVTGETVVNPHDTSVRTLWRLADDARGDDGE